MKTGKTMVARSLLLGISMILSGCARTTTTNPVQAPDRAAVGPLGTGGVPDTDPNSGLGHRIFNLISATFEVPPGTRDSRDFSPDHADRLVWLCSRNYLQRKEILIWREDSRITVSLRGTVLRDIGDNLETQPATVAGGIAFHSGYLARAREVVETLRSGGDIETLRRDPNRLLELTGHSLGGASAQITAALLVEEGVNPSQMVVYTYGAPPSCIGDFASRYGAVRIYRVEGEGDFIPELFNGPRYFYRHVGVRVYLPRTGQYAFQNRTDYPVSTSLLDPAPNRVVKALFEHLSFTYLRRSTSSRE